MSKKIDFTNKKVGNWTVLYEDGKNKFGNFKWKCKCICGNEKSIVSSALQNKTSMSCGCQNNKVKFVSIGEQYGYLTISKRVENDSKGHSQWLCKCMCGKDIVVRGYGLTGGTTKSCGCKRTKDRNLHSNWNGCGEISGCFFKQIKRGADRRNILFEISIEYIWELFLNQNRKCALSGLDIKFSLSNSKINKTEVTASLDRINNKLGYIKGNVQWLHKDINIMKLDHNQDKFIELCILISDKYKVLL